MITAVATCRPDANMERAAHLMWSNDCGVVPVLDERDHVIGMVTDRDLLMGAYTQGRTLGDLRVADCMSKEVRSSLPTQSLEDVIRELGNARVRRMPVIDESGTLQGILSLNDVVRHVEAMEESPTRSRLAALILSTMAAICEPRGQHRTPEPQPVKPARASRTVGAS